MQYFIMFIGLGYALIHTDVIFPGWHWLPETPIELVSEVAILILLGLGVIYDKLKKIEKKLDK